MAVVDDYLAVRPEAEPRLRALAATGRMAMGPWYALPDEFLVSGETLVRNLQRGLRVASRFGGAMDVGYLPDMFGHVAQMPQLLRLFGYEHAVVWRGVPSAIDRSGFWWTAPDGSTVRAEYLPQGYGNGALVPDDAKALVRRIGEFEEEQGDLLTGPILWMNGTDHLMPQPWLGRVVAEANDLDLGYELHICSLAEHVRRAPTEGCPPGSGELRSGARANLLMGVASNRVDVKQAAARAERSLERLAEPLSALFLPADHWPAALLDEAWLEVIRNSAHDSICACSVDEVCDAVLHRFAEATQIAEGLTDRALHALGATIGVDGRTPVIVNPSPRARGGVVELRLRGAEVPPGTQLVSERLAEWTMVEDAAIEVATVMVAELEYVRNVAVVHRAGVRRHRAHPRRPRAGRHPRHAADPAAARRPARRAGRRAGVGARHHPAGQSRCWPTSPTSPGYGWQAWTGASSPVDPVTADGAPARQRDRHGGGRPDRRHLRRSTATAGSAGSSTAATSATPTTGARPTATSWSTRRRRCRPRVVEAGPVRAPARDPPHLRPAHPRRRRHAAPARRRSRCSPPSSCSAGDDLVRVHVELDNHGVRDHRLRAVFPLPSGPRSSVAECAFATVERGLVAEGGPTEQGLATYPSRRFVTAGGPHRRPRGPARVRAGRPRRRRPPRPARSPSPCCAAPGCCRRARWPPGRSPPDR